MDEWRQRGGILWPSLVWGITAVVLAVVLWKSVNSPATLVMAATCWLLVPIAYVQNILYLRNGRLILSADSITHLDWRGNARKMPRNATTTLAEGRFRGTACFFLQPPEGRQIILPKRLWQLDDPARAQPLSQGVQLVKKPFLRPLP